MPVLLSLADVSRFYGPKLVFKNVSLEIRAGTVTLLAGTNGAGKSTLLKIMAGLIRPSSGTVSGGAPANPAVGGPCIGYIGHQTFLYPDLSAIENLRFWTALHKRRFTENELLEMLERVELAAFAGEKAGGFSRGMAQRLSLARAFLLRPELLLLDEPGTGLDVRATAILRREIAAAKSAGAGVVWISHSLDNDLPLADQAALLERRTLRYFGPAGDFPGFSGKEAAGC